MMNNIEFNTFPRFRIVSVVLVFIACSIIIKVDFAEAEDLRQFVGLTP